MDGIRNILDIGSGFEKIIDWLTENADWLFDFIAMVVEGFLDSINWLFNFPPAIVMIVIFTLLAWKIAGRGSRCFYSPGDSVWLPIWATGVKQWIRFLWFFQL